MKERSEKQTRRRKLARAAAIAGALLALACHFLPHEYQDACRAVAKAASLSVGGCS